MTVTVTVRYSNENDDDDNGNDGDNKHDENDKEEEKEEEKNAVRSSRTNFTLTQHNDKFAEESYFSPWLNSFLMRAYILTLYIGGLTFQKNKL